ncbi:MAG: homocysteine S-methyltransferase family protein [Candidatus Latescibacteria bacterium]|nr:homocysteine S-methyltransferase family protein [Candidatus Latescibacterota bacterium]
MAQWSEARRPTLARLPGWAWLADGAMGTMVQTAGLPSGECPESWNVTHPERIIDIHRQYLDAGCDIILTNTFGGSRLKLRRFGLGDRVGDFNRAGVRLARSAARPEALIAASIGPTGELPEPYGEVSVETFILVFAEQIAAVAEEGVDLIWIETMSDLTEACAAITAAQATCQLPIITTMTFERSPRGYHTMMGVSPTEAARCLLDAGADCVGANCGLGSDDTVEIIRAMRAAVPDAMLVAKPNAGLPQWNDGQALYPETPEWMAARVPRLIDAGVRIFGGCCGTTPEHVRAMARAGKTVVGR